MARTIKSFLSVLGEVPLIPHNMARILKHYILFVGNIRSKDNKKETRKRRGVR
jgi:hypothetical protein